MGRNIPAAIKRELSMDPCYYCGDLIAGVVDHVIPVSRGGTNDRDNLVAACRPCNMEKLTFTADEWRAWRERAGLPWPPISRTSQLFAQFKAMTEGWTEEQFESYGAELRATSEERRRVEAEREAAAEAEREARRAAWEEQEQITLEMAELAADFAEIKALFAERFRA